MQSWVGILHSQVDTLYGRWSPGQTGREEERTMKGGRREGGRKREREREQEAKGLVGEGFLSLRPIQGHIEVILDHKITRSHDITQSYKKSH